MTESYPKYPYYSKETKCETLPVPFPPQHQSQQPGLEYLMKPRPIYENPAYTGSGKLKDKGAFITGGDSGIGRAAAIAFAKEGADVAFTYLYEQPDADETKRRIEELGRRCLALRVDMRSKANCTAAVLQTIQTLGKLNIVVNNQAVQYPKETPMKRAAQPFELAPAYVYLASDDSRYVTGETLHVNGGDFISS